MYVIHTDELWMIDPHTLPPSFAFVHSLSLDVSLNSTDMCTRKSTCIYITNSDYLLLEHVRGRQFITNRLLQTADPRVIFTPNSLS